MNWHYIEYRDADIIPDDLLWVSWLEANVGEYNVDWKWDDYAGYYFICFAKSEDAIAFRLKFGL
jgi:hypothetical protein